MDIQTRMLAANKRVGWPPEARHLYTTLLLWERRTQLNGDGEVEDSPFLINQCDLTFAGVSPSREGSRFCLNWARKSGLEIDLLPQAFGFLEEKGLIRIECCDHPFYQHCLVIEPEVGEQNGHGANQNQV